MSMTPVVILIICPMIFLPTNDQNADKTGLEKYVPKIVNGELHCRREIIPVIDPAYEQGADEQPYSKFHCMRAGIMEAIGWNMRHRHGKERVLKNTCPTPVVKNGKWVYEFPECGYWGNAKIKCDFPEAI